jgi:hypothetical protein
MDEADRAQASAAAEDDEFPDAFQDDGGDGDRKAPF